MNISKYSFRWIFLSVILINTQYATVQEKQPVFSSQSMHQVFLDDIIQDLNNASCKGDDGLHHLGGLLEFFALHKKDYTNLKTVFKLFSNRYKGVEYINARKLSIFLEDLYTHVPNCTNVPFDQALLYDATSFERFTKEVKTRLIKDFSEQFTDFKKDPESFISNVAKKITKQVEQELELVSMQQTVTRFLEIAISKIIWSPYDQEKTWESMQHLCKQFVLLLEKNIITDVDALDDLLWSLVHRYCYFVELTGSLLVPGFYEKVLRDLKNEKLIMSIVEEQDELLKPKTVFLKEKIITAQAKALSGSDKKL